MLARATVIAVLVLAYCISAVAQQPAAKPKTATTSSTSHAGGADVVLPSEEMVNAFMQQSFGYDPQLTWKIVSIKPSKAEGLAEVNVQISSPQGQGTQTFFVSADGKHAVVGEIIPFGKHPFESAKLELQKNATGPARGPANAPVNVVEFSDLQCPHCKEANPTIERLVKDDPDVHGRRKPQRTRTAPRNFRMTLSGSSLPAFMRPKRKSPRRTPIRN